MEKLLIIDAHSHLWLKQDTMVDGSPIRTLQPNASRSEFFGEERQMLPPFMIDGKNTAEVFLSNMDYAQVGAAVVVQEVIDGNQNAYLTEVQAKYPNRFFCMGMAWTLEEAEMVQKAGLRGIAFPGHRMKESLHTLMPIFKFMEEQGMMLSMCLGETPRQIAEMAEVIQECPKLKVAIGHFGMVTTSAFESQVKLALEGPCVMIESGGITWLYNAEFYPFPSAVRSMRQAADWVGIDRLMWGSDYPRTITAITYRMSYDFLFRSNLFTPEEQAAFLGQNAQRFYDFKNLPDLPYIKNMSE
ncbi:MAG: amidohydrolase [Bacteroidaceae bacterium]|nr:amidohydrolase [Bacteroidaceae bacterium]